MEARPPVSESLREYLRGLAGGLMFSLPLLYKMEVWWAGFIAEPMRLLVGLLAVFLLLLGYNQYAGLRHDATWLEVVIDSVEELGLGLLVAAGMLFLLGRLEPGLRLSENLGKIVVEGMTVAIGISIGTSQLGGGSAEDGEKGSAGSGAGRSAKQEVHFGGQLVIAFCGAVLFAANVAPTEEILVIASESRLVNLLGISVMSIVLSALILYYIEFSGARRFVQRDGFSSVLGGSVVSYAVALVASAAVLWFYGRFDQMPLGTCLAQTVVLGLAAALGASAGRLLLQ